MSEDTETVNAIKYLNTITDCFAFRITPGVYGSRGKSDIIACYNGLFIAIEMKVGSNKPSDQQERFLKNVQVKGGGLSIVCWSCNEVKELMKCVENTLYDQLGLWDELKLFRHAMLSSLKETKLKAVKKNYVDFKMKK